ncbi:hypothetical protein [Enterococcus avium]|uniref:hypothetical protein n=1 Tax=Enterococcus avium TaxID=33945 RepID=UPI001CEDAA4B|nr:hypothetical protein [Enterococcus avium]
MDYLLSIDEHLRTSYDVYQNLLEAFDAKSIKTFTNTLITYPRCLIQHLKKRFFT